MENLMKTSILNGFCVLALFLLSCTPPILQTPPQAGQVQGWLSASGSLLQGDQVITSQKLVCLKSTGKLSYSVKVICMEQKDQSDPIALKHLLLNDPDGIPAVPASTIGTVYTPPLPALIFGHAQGLYLSQGGVLVRLEKITQRREDLKETRLLPLDNLSSQEQLSTLSGLVETPDGMLYLADWKHHQVFKLAQGKLTLFAGSGQAGFQDGKAQTAQFNQIQALEADGQGNLYLLEKGSHRLRKITPDGTVSTLAGGSEAGYREGPGSEARLNQPSALAVSSEGVVFVADTGNHRIRRLEPDGQVSTFVGNGQVGVEKGEVNSTPALNGPRLEVAVTPTSLALGPEGLLYFSSGQRIFRTPTL